MVIPIAHSSQTGTPTSSSHTTENKQTVIPCKWNILFWTWRWYLKTDAEWVWSWWMEAYFQNFAALFLCAFWCCFVVLILKFVLMLLFSRVFVLQKLCFNVLSVWRELVTKVAFGGWKWCQFTSEEWQTAKNKINAVNWLNLSLNSKMLIVPIINN